MTVTQSYSLSLTYTSLRMYLPQTAPAAVPASSENKPAASTGDTVTLSPEATAPPETQVPAQPVDESQAPAASPEAPSAPTSRAARRAEVLLDALDADQDGAVTKEEFLDGAMALLRHAGAHHHHHRVHDQDSDHGRHEGHGMRRLERKLDRLFERVDDSGDGSVDQAELTDALMKVTREPRPATTEAPAPSAQETLSQGAPSPSSSETPEPATVPHTPPAAATFYTSVTVVIAVKQYTSIAAMNA
jgi:hypothetical protein